MEQHIHLITPKELKEKLSKGENLEIIDVREHEEVAQGMIPGAKHIPMNEIPSRLEELDVEKEHIFICRSGRRSENVCHYLHDQGYKVVNMVGGMLEWEGNTELPK
ncbi:rhodanese-like domain-containing protein [Bacillus suaedaesalsae]|uniref:Rhodanese-like domain-containing protein n=1 Tax=Bacillus suaedaesalsae TaxID=2810349 RepID=A0ABS2DD61_9BACI|nr:rhodanese-like domain-containing protein [Bacillus suaedaesalsae]MBM6616377.1 rhodanese-like domain-containing protein [Bacillus suaedaesalsae]